MKIFDRTTNREIYTLSSKDTGTDRVLEQYKVAKGNEITNITFGSTARGTINGQYFPSTIVFKDCTFRYVTFINLDNYSFINCTFTKCYFRSSANIKMVDCIGHESFFDDYKYTLSGNCVFDNCKGISFNGSIDPDSNITIHNTPELQFLVNVLKEKRKLEEEDRLKALELRKSIKYGYKVVNAKVLVKLSFPDEVDIVNLDKDKSRASGAMVESVHIINNFKEEGVTNKAYCKTEYKVGQMVYPDHFNANPREDCGHGIHFCKNIDDLRTYGSLTWEEINSIKEQNL